MMGDQIKQQYGIDGGDGENQEEAPESGRLTEEEESKLKEMIRKKKTSRPDFSDNFLNELNPHNLAGLYERSLMEL